MKVAAIVHPKLAQASFEKAIQPLLTAPAKYEKAGVKLLAFSFPYLDVEVDWHLHASNIRLRIDGTDFPYRPVGGWWIDQSNNPLLLGLQQVPSGNGFHVNDQDGKPRCGFCFRGWREYHNHSGHQDISWASIRRDSRYSMLQLVMQLVKDLNSTAVMKI
ncbi:MAG: hypothetical protein PHY16_19640 [Methylobacter sp.]|nr:hypothetical protein [Methylobacter sp.]